MIDKPNPSIDDIVLYRLIKVSSTSYLSAPESAQPPPFQSGCVLFKNGEDVSFPKGQLIRCLRDVVVEGSGFHAFLLETSR